METQIGVFQPMYINEHELFLSAIKNNINTSIRGVLQPYTKYS